MNEILDPIRRNDSKISMGRKHTVPIKEHATSKSEHDPEFIQSSTIHIKDRPLLLNVLIQLIDTTHILGKVQGQIKEVCRLIEP